MRFAVCRCLRWLVRSSSKIRSMIPGERTQLWPPRRRASAIPWRHRERQHLTDRLAVYTKHPARPRGCSSPRHDTPAEPVRTTPPDTSPPPSSQSNPDRRLYAVPFWSAAAGSTGRFSGGLLLCRSQSPSITEKWVAIWRALAIWKRFASHHHSSARGSTTQKRELMLGWTPKYDLERLVDSAWDYQRAPDDPRITWYPG